MQQHLFALSFGFAALIAATRMAEAQANCADHQTVVESLAETYGETRQGLGIAANNAVLEIFASTESGTWTVTVTMPGGPTCLVASGVAWESVAEELPAPGEGA